MFFLRTNQTGTLNNKNNGKLKFESVSWLLAIKAPKIIPVQKSPNAIVEIVFPEKINFPILIDFIF